MSKQSTAIIGGFEAAYGTIWVTPHREQQAIGGVIVGVADKELPKGTVVAVGKVPFTYWRHRLRIGSTVVFARTVANVMRLPVLNEMGEVEEVEVKCLMWPDLRGDFPPAGVTGGDKNSNHGFLQKVRSALLRFSLSGAIFFLLGFMSFPVILNWSRFKDWLRDIRSRRDGGQGT